ncbi:MAG: protein kinase, partial [Planctomycetaceae bacterium]|nr:protein kinase [Planctomycetaceae bacterium]
MNARQSNQNLQFLYLCYQEGLLVRRQLVEGISEWLSDEPADVREFVQQQDWMDAQAIEKVNHILAETSGDEETGRGETLRSRVAGDAELEHLTDAICQEESTVSEASIREQLAAILARPEEEDTAWESQTVVPSTAPATRAEERTIGPAADTTLESPTIVPTSGGSTPGSTVGSTSSVGGRFEVLREVAKGGLGQVSLAQDNELNREVALKELLVQHTHDADLVERFQMEAEITGRLEHPGVVPVYGRGQHASGAGYYVMRFVRGEELRDAVKAFHDKYDAQLANGPGRVEFMQLLRQFVHVCQTIGYAHSRGIIHRDLKPSNIMLGKYGETFVVDWGLAKPVDSEEEYPTEGKISMRSFSGSGSQATQMGSTVGTPEFMSPEQADGRIEDVGPISDIYCLGATLYYLLTREPPVSGRNLYDIVERVSAGDIRKPRELNASVPKALDAICMKAIALKVEDRYQEAEDLAADIEKWIADEPVSVAPDSLLDRGRRWFRHHRGLAVTGLVSLVVVAGIASVSSVFINRARLAEADQRSKAEDATEVAKQTAAANLKLANSERDAKQEALARRQEALANFKQARSAVDTALTGISEILKYYPGVQRARLGLLEKVAEDYLKFASQKSDDEEIQVESGRAFLRLGEVRQTLNELDRAEEAFGNGEMRFREILEVNPGNETASLELATALTKRAILAELRGDHAPANELYEEVILELRNRVKTGKQQDLAREGLATALSNRAGLQLSLGDVRPAESAALESLSLYEQLRKESPEKKNYTVGAAQLLNILGSIKNQTGRGRDAARDFQAGMDLFKSLIEEEPDYPPYLQARATLSISLAISMRKFGNIPAELAAYDVAIKDYQQLAESLPDIPEFQENLALTQTDVAQVWQETGNSRKAVDLLTRAIVVFDRLYQQHVDVPRYGEELGACSGVLGFAHTTLGNLQEADRFLKIARDVFSELVQLNPAVGQYQHRLAITNSQVAQLLAMDQQHVKAIETVEGALKTMTALVTQFPGVTGYGDTLASITARKSLILADAGEKTTAAVA